MAKKRRKLTPTQRRKALKNLAKARAARKSRTVGRAKRGKARLVVVAPKKRKKTMAKKRRRRAAPKKRRGGTRRGGSRGGLMSGIEWMDMGGAGAYGLLEKQVAEKGDEAYLKKVPLFFEGIGYAGCSAVLAHIIGKNVGGIVGKAARHYARGTFAVAAYKLAKHGKLYEAGEADAALAGDDDDLGADDEFTIGVGDDDDLGYGADGIAGDDD